MWRRLCSDLRTVVPKRSRFLATASSSSTSPATSYSRLSISFFSRHFASQKAESVVKRVEDVMPIATGHEREELEAELKGRKILEEANNFVGPFGTKESPAVITSYYNKRIVGCSGDEGEDEHDVFWFWLEKGKLHECPVCSQYFALKVIGPGGPPDGHDDDDDHHCSMQNPCQNNLWQK